MPDLFQFYSPVGPERVGFILTSGEVAEVENICPLPEEGFEVRADDVIKYLDEATATWHTHPGSSSNLSSDDLIAFKNYPMLQHFVIGHDGLRCFFVRDGAVLEDQESHLPRPVEGPVP